MVKEGNSGRIDHGQGNEPRQHTEDLDATPSNIKKESLLIPTPSFFPSFIIKPRFLQKIRKKRYESCEFRGVLLFKKRLRSMM